MSSSKRQAPASVVWISSSLAGVMEGITVQPFDMIKTRNHLLVNSTPPSLVQSFKSIYAEGGIGRFYRGLLPELTGMIPKTSAMYSSYELSRRYLSKNPFFKESSNWKICAMAGFISGYAEALTVCPFQVIKVRLQSKMYLGKYKNSLHCIRIVLREEGIKSLFIGIGPTLWRNCVWNTIYFGLMSEIKQKLPKNESSFGLAQTLLAGFCGGTIATLFNAPFDCVKSRFQQQNISQMDKYKSTLRTLWMIYCEEGVKGCYRGLEAKIIRMGIGGAVCMATFEGLNEAYLRYTADHTEQSMNAMFL